MNSKLLLVGTGPLEEEIKEKLQNLKIEDKVIFTGFATNVNEYLQAMDVFIMPSLYEGLPITAIEAQASGLPCFLSKYVITPEAKITDDLMFISLNDQPQEWAKKILSKNLSRKDNREKIKKAGYLIEDTADELQKFYLN